MHDHPPELDAEAYLLAGTEISDIGHALIACVFDGDEPSAQAATEVVLRGRPSRSVARELGVPETSVRRWADKLRRVMSKILARPGVDPSIFVACCDLPPRRRNSA